MSRVVMLRGLDKSVIVLEENRKNMLNRERTYDMHKVKKNTVEKMSDHFVHRYLFIKNITEQILRSSR